MSVSSAKDIKHIRLFSLLVLTLTSCAPVQPTTPEQVAQDMQVSTSEFDTDISYISKRQRTTLEDEEDCLSCYIEYNLAISKDKKTGKVSQPILLVKVKYFDRWRFYDSISLEDGTTKKVEVFDRQITSCGGTTCHIVESVGQHIERDFLERHKTGFRARLNGKTQTIFEVPGNYVEGFLLGLRVPGRFV